MEKNYLDKISEKSEFDLNTKISLSEIKIFKLEQIKEQLILGINEINSSSKEKTFERNKNRITKMNNELSFLEVEMLRLTIDVKNLKKEKRSFLN